MTRLRSTAWRVIVRRPRDRGPAAPGLDEGSAARSRQSAAACRPAHHRLTSSGTRRRADPVGSRRSPPSVGELLAGQGCRVVPSSRRSAPPRPSIQFSLSTTMANWPASSTAPLVRRATYSTPPAREPGQVERAGVPTCGRWSAAGNDDFEGLDKAPGGAARRQPRVRVKAVEFERLFPPAAPRATTRAIALVEKTTDQGRGHRPGPVDDRDLGVIVGGFTVSLLGTADPGRQLELERRMQRRLGWRLVHHQPVDLQSDGSRIETRRGRAGRLDGRGADLIPLDLRAAPASAASGCWSPSAGAAPPAHPLQGRPTADDPARRAPCPGDHRACPGRPGWRRPMAGHRYLRRRRQAADRARHYTAGPAEHLPVHWNLATGENIRGRSRSARGFTAVRHQGRRWSAPTKAAASQLARRGDGLADGKPAAVDPRRPSPPHDRPLQRRLLEPGGRRHRVCTWTWPRRHEPTASTTAKTTAPGRRKGSTVVYDGDADADAFPHTACDRRSLPTGSTKATPGAALNVRRAVPPHPARHLVERSRVISGCRRRSAGSIRGLPGRLGRQSRLAPAPDRSVIADDGPDAVTGSRARAERARPRRDRRHRQRPRAYTAGSRFQLLIASAALRRPGQQQLDANRLPGNTTTSRRPRPARPTVQVGDEDDIAVLEEGKNDEAPAENNVGSPAPPTPSTPPRTSRRTVSNGAEVA